MNRRQERFVEGYLVSLNGAQAALDAGYSPKWARVAASLLLTNPNVASVIVERQAARLARTRLNAADVLEGVRRLAFSDIRTVVSWDAQGRPTIRPSADLAPEEAYAIKKIRVTKTGEMEVELHDKTGPLRLLLDHLGLTPRARTATGGPIYQQNNLTVNSAGPSAWRSFYAKVTTEELAVMLGESADFLTEGPPAPLPTDGED